MSNRSFTNWHLAAEEGRQRLVVGGIVAHRLDAGLVGFLQSVEHSIDRFVGIGRLSLALHGIEIIHIGLIGLFIVAEHTHLNSRLALEDVLTLDAFSSREPLHTSLENAMTLFNDLWHHKEMILGFRRIPDDIVGDLA